MITIKKRFLVAVFFTSIVFLFSMWILLYYTAGDQLHYRKAYDLFSRLNIVDGYKAYFVNLGASEPLSFLLEWVFSNFGVDKDLFISIFNAILAYVSILYLQKKQIPIIFIFLIVCLNFYFIVLYTGAERLKFGMIFMILSFYYIDNRKFFIIFSILAVLAHFQTIIIYVAILFALFSKKLFFIVTNLKISRNISLVLLVVLVALVFNMYFYEKISGKIEAYFNPDFLNLQKIFIYFLFTCVVARSRRDLINILLVYIPLFIFTYFLGGERINMLAFFVLIYFALLNRNRIFLLTPMLVYFSVKSYFFIEKIILFGNGFYK